MKNKTFFVLFLFVLLFSTLFMAQKAQYLQHERNIANSQAEKRDYIFYQPIISIKAISFQSLFEYEIITVNSIIPNYQANENGGSVWVIHFPTFISIDGIGNFAIAWADYRNEDYDIYAQRYSSNGTAFESNFRVKNTNKKSQSDPKVKLWKNRIYNTWRDNRTGGTMYDIWANVSDWDDPVGIINQKLSQIPSSLILYQKNSNPFNQSTRISCSIQKSGLATLKIYNILGKEIQTIVNGFQKAGIYSVSFNASKLSSGIYFYKLQVGNDFAETKRMMFLR